ncbi:MAG: DUF1987 domain-containing protein [Bacteroidales bacterium]|nr:DUF1987 domain-containing protein [Bacteroidales bacterium]
MEDIHITGSKDCYIQPSVDFVESTGLCDISGESFMEETATFYTPLVEWVKEYSKTHDKIVFTCSLTYYNTSTSKWLLALLKELRAMEKRGGSVSVIWYYTPDDTDMNDDIMDYMVDTGLKIKLTPFEEV